MTFMASEYTLNVLLLLVLPDSQRALCVLGEDDGDPLQLADVAADPVLENTPQEAALRPSGRHLLTAA